MFIVPDYFAIGALALGILVLIGVFVLLVRPNFEEAASPFRRQMMHRQSKLDARAEEILRVTCETNAILLEIRDLLKSSSADS